MAKTKIINRSSTPEERAQWAAHRTALMAAHVAKFGDGPRVSMPSGYRVSVPSSSGHDSSDDEEPCSPEEPSHASASTGEAEAADGEAADGEAADGEEPSFVSSSPVGRFNKVADAMSKLTTKMATTKLEMRFFDNKISCIKASIFRASGDKKRLVQLHGELRVAMEQHTALARAYWVAAHQIGRLNEVELGPVVDDLEMIESLP
jgi:hypothetical protein